MEAETHPDPLREAVSLGLQRTMQAVSCAVTAAQVVTYHQKTQARIVAQQDERARRALTTQIRADRDAARAGWAPALDERWLRNAAFYDTARAWSAAVPYADRNVPWYEPAAATALRKTEERLRELHPFAMARYDRLRADGVPAAEAMEEAAPLFALSPRARSWPHAPRSPLTAGTGTDPGIADTTAPGTETSETPSADLEERGRNIAAALQEQARAEQRDPLGPDELRTVLETITNLPYDVIHRVTRPAAADGLATAGQDRAGTAERARAADLDAATDRAATPALDERTDKLAQAGDAAATASAATARGTRPWERDFPVPIRDVVASTASPAQAAAPPSAPPRPAVSQAPRTGGRGHA